MVGTHRGIGDVAAVADPNTGVAVRWRPFLLGPIFGSQGWNDSPFNIYPMKGKYMWRDLERVCAREGLPLTQPPLKVTLDPHYAVLRR